VKGAVSFPHLETGHHKKIFFVQHQNTSSIISLRYQNDEQCSILVSKNNNKYRLQGSSLNALLLPLMELVARLRTFAQSKGTSMDLLIVLEEDVPIPSLIESVDAHFSLRVQYKEAKDAMDRASSQVALPHVRILGIIRSRAFARMDA
jgi:hypothetical protein